MPPVLDLMFTEDENEEENVGHSDTIEKVTYMAIMWDLGLKTTERVLTIGTETMKNMQTLKLC